MKAKIVDKADLKKSPEELEAERVLGQLNDQKAVEVTLDGESTRTIRRAFNKAAGTLGLELAFRMRGDKMYVLIKETK